MLSQSGSIDPQDGDRSFSETWFVGRHALYARHSRELPAAGSSRHRQKIAAIPASASILISAITLATHDMARAVRFYRMLGFEVIYGGDDAAFTSFRAGTSYLNLIAQRPSECGPGGDASRGMKRRMRPMAFSMPPFCHGA